MFGLRSRGHPLISPGPVVGFLRADPVFARVVLAIGIEVLISDNRDVALIGGAKCLAVTAVGFAVARCTGASQNAE